MSLSNLAQEREKKLAELQRSGKEASLERTAKKQGIPYVNIVGNPSVLDHKIMALVKKEDAERGRAIPISLQNTNIRIGVIDPNNEETQEVVKALEQRGYSITFALISIPSLQRAFEEYAHVILPQKRGLSGKLLIPKTTKTPSSLLDLRSNLTEKKSFETSALLALLVNAGLSLGASDIHIEPIEGGARLRFRLDGLLEDIGEITKETYGHILSRLKVLSSIPINVPTRAHDGRFSIERSGEEAEVRTSILPSPEGEYVVLRLLNPNTVALEIDDLGIEDDLWKSLKTQLASQNGIILTTGPTGSGKTTTLYAFLKHLNTHEVKIITLENPIEYHLKGISQTQIDAKDEYGFSKGVRAALRHDPDIILVGEIRDNETADAALSASLTGHLVFSTLHTNDAAGAIPRFLDLNAKASILSSALRTIIAQRLVRRLCKKCRAPLKGADLQSALQEIQEVFSAYPSLKEKIEIIYTTGEGCEECSQTGYKGRTGVFEILIIEEGFEKLIASSPSHREVLDYALKRGFQTMYVNGLRKIVKGITSFEEVHRVTTKISAAQKESP